MKNAPSTEMDKETLARYSRQILMPEFGRSSQSALTRSRVLVVGAGGLGSPVISYLAAAGIGTIGIVDDDFVDVTNLHRQIIHEERAVGTAKVLSAQRWVHEHNSNINVLVHQTRLNEVNGLAIADDYDVIVDGSDNFATRYLVGDISAIQGKPLVWGSVFKFSGQTTVFWPGHGPTYRDVFPEMPPPGAVPSCAEAGVIGAVCATIGSTMALEVVKLIAGIGEPLVGRLLTFDGLTQRWRELDISGAAGSTPIPSALSREQPPACLIPDVADVSLTASYVAEMLRDREAGGRPFRLIDVRTEEEHVIAAIDGAELVPMAVLEGEASAWNPTDSIVVFCKSGVRSNEAHRLLEQRGFTDVRTLKGGIDAWSATVDPTLARY
ncbi:ThiF family adenylyltransferase [Curtobacterium sp. MCPF17_021]|uniref:ThiF family adenylyltransferase n=1 Tax=Curtobacterium sp. MCPF17_021 TaxID=2175639 RepID=UPI000DA7437C|nr:ThiF family adenylyltransferase [Curtobacterium sp. MCPF17_021]WIE83451.1 ThiF family adenylyltransferase [Curtobacterium sp. MCPF17_021]